MKDAILYCDRCGRIILPSAIAGGTAIASEATSLCPTCAEGLTPEQREEMKTQAGAPEPPTPAGPKRKTSPRGRLGVKRQAAARAGASSSSRKSSVPTWVVFPAGAVIGFLAVVVVRHSGGGDRRGAGATSAGRQVQASRQAETAAPLKSSGRVPREPTALVTPGPVPAPLGPASSPAGVDRAGGEAEAAPDGTSEDKPEVATLAARLAKIREIPDPPFYRRYDDFTSAVDEFLKEFGETHEAEQVRALLEQVRGDFAKQAGGQLDTAMETARAFLEKGEYDQASRAFAYVKMLYGESDWYRTTGGPRIEGELARIAEAKEAFEKSGVKVDDDFSGYEEGSDGSPRWQAGPGWKVAGGSFVCDQGGTSVAVMNVPDSKVVDVEATVTPRARTGGGWTMVGIAVHKDDSNYWYMSLVKAADGASYLEFGEKLNGVWRANFEGAKLTRTQSGGCGVEFGKRFRFRIELRPDGITGSVGPEGGAQATVSYKFDNTAVTSGRPALRVEGISAEFDDVKAIVRGEIVQ